MRMPGGLKPTMLLKSLTHKNEKIIKGAWELCSRRIEPGLQTITMEKNVLFFKTAVLAHTSSFIPLFIYLLAQLISIPMQNGLQISKQLFSSSSHRTDLHSAFKRSFNFTGMTSMTLEFFKHNCNSIFFDTNETFGVRWDVNSCRQPLVTGSYRTQVATQPHWYRIYMTPKVNSRARAP